MNANWLKNVGREFAQLGWGTALSQIISVAALPIIARLYDPNSFGAFALFLLGGQSIGLILAGRYEQLVMILRQPDGIIALVRICLSVAAAASGVLCIVLLTYSSSLDRHFHTDLGWGWPAMALYSFAVSAGATLFTACIRFSELSLISGSRFTKTAVALSLQVALGLAGYGGLFGLVIGEAMSVTLMALVLFIGLDSHLSVARSPNAKRARRYALLHMSKNRQFPTANLLHVFIHSISAWLVILLVSFCFNAQDAGSYSMMSRIIVMPATLIGGIVSQSYLRSAAESKRNTGTFKAPFTSYATFSAMLALITALGFAFAGQEAFRLVLGEKWANAGTLSELVAPYIACHFVLSVLAPSVQLSGRMWQAFALNALQNATYLLLLFVAAKMSLGLVSAVELATYGVAPVMLCNILAYWAWSKIPPHGSMNGKTHRLYR